MVWLLVALGVYLGLLFAVSWISLHPPRVPVFLGPGVLGAPQQDFETSSADGTLLKGWWMPADDAPVVVVCVHGYLMNRSELALQAARLWKMGCSCLLVDLRAHGRSGGRTCGLGKREAADVAAVARWARERSSGAKVVLYGSSMGAAASALALADDPELAHGLVLDCAYSRLPSAVLGWWRFVGGVPLAVLLGPSVVVTAPLVGFNPFSVDVARALQRVHQPTLLFHGDRDTLALPREAERNAAACRGPSRLVWLPGCGHAEGRWIHPELYEAELHKFVRELFP